jgi:hypothetical protein
MFANYLEGRAGILGRQSLQRSGNARLVLLCGLLNSVDSILPDDNYYAI